MKSSIYDRIPKIATPALRRLRKLWIMQIESRLQTPRHDYVGKCVIRATLELERRGRMKASKGG